MTESVVNEADIRQYWSTQERVTYWVQQHDGLAFSSPNMTPSVLEGEEGALSCGVSDVESSHSLPPKLMLRYPDGTEIPIPHPSSPQGSQNNGQLNGNGNANGPPSHRSRSGSAPSRHPSKNPSSPHSEKEREKLRSRSPEQIRIFPSDSTAEAIIDEVHRSHTQASSHSHGRSRSLPRNGFSPEEAIQLHDPMPYTNSHSHSRAPIKIPRTPPPDSSTRPNLARSQPAPWHPYGTNAHNSHTRMTPVQMTHPHRHVHNPKHVPPSIVYAPSSNSRGYNPPAIYAYPPNFGPDGVMYSHSVPPTKMYRNGAGSVYPSAGAPSGGGGGYHPPPPVPSSQVPRHRHRSRDRSREHLEGEGGHSEVPPPPVPTSHSHSQSQSRHRSRDRDREHSEERRHRHRSHERERGREEPEENRHRSRSRSGSQSQSQPQDIQVSRGTNGSSKSKRRGHDRTRSLPLQGIVAPPPAPAHPPPRPDSPSGSDASGSTYYVMPNGRQKIHILHPNHNPGSIRTATSSTKSPTVATPISPAGSLKKPFFARLRGLAERLSSSGSSGKSESRRVRRHSTGGRAGLEGTNRVPHAR